MEISQYFKIQTKSNDLEEEESEKAKWRKRARERGEEGTRELCMISVPPGTQACILSGLREFSVRKTDLKLLKILVIINSGN